MILKRRLILLFSFCFLIFSGFAQSKELVVKVNLDQKKITSLDSNSQSFVKSAYMKILQDLTMISEISIRTSEVDNELREIQKQSQIEAATGLGSEDSAYAADKGIRADLLMNITLNNTGSNNYQFVITVSEIETMKMIITESSDRLIIAELTKDTVVDNLIYNVLTALNKRGYISQISGDVTNQLLHLDSSEESFRKYVQEYTRQREAAEAELEKLRKNAKSEEDRMELEAQRLALQLKIEMAEKNRQIAEENLRRQQAEDAAKSKRQKEMEQMQNAQREKFLKDIQAIEDARSAIRKETLTSLSLKKRIELIESARTNLNRLENQLSDTIGQNSSYYDEKMQAEIDAVNAEPWRKADLSNGEPTERALAYRKQKIDKIRSSYEAQRKAGENQLRNAAKSTIDSYKNQLQSNLSDMAKTTYVFRSIDVTDDYLTLSVSEFDGERLVWDVNSYFDLNNIPKISDGKIYLPKSSLSYEMMTGKKPDLSTDAGYQTYQDMVDMADLYFRTSVPYLYSQIAIKVSYNNSLSEYEIKPVAFQIFKTQDNKKPIVSYNESQIEAAKYLYKKDATPNTDNTVKTEPKTTDSNSEVFVPSTTYTSITESNFYKSQEARRGLFLESTYLNGPFYQGVDINLSAMIGGKFFFAGVDMDLAYPQIKSEYTSISDWSSFYISNIDAILGCSVKLLILKPYLAFGIGRYSISNEKMYDDKISGLLLEGIAGMDLCLGSYSLGVVYKLKYLYGAGFVDTYGFSLGLIW